MSKQQQTAEPTVRDYVEHICDGKLSSEELVTQYQSNIAQTEEQIHAWKSIDNELTLKSARHMDELRKQGFAVGSLHGIPVGVKDIIDTDNLPTAYGSPIYDGHRPEANARIVDKLLEAGAVVMGKTVTTEFAWMNESETRNPHNPDYSPGGSSSGSAAAVAAGHVPLAIGSQTGGSVIRPASFNGVFGFKPSRGLISRSGVLQTSTTLDQMGAFGRNLGDVALLIDSIQGHDQNDPLTRPEPKPEMLKGFLEKVPASPALAWIDMPYADRYSNDVSEGFAELLEILESETDASIDRLPAPDSFSTIMDAQQLIHDFEILRNLGPHWQNNREKLSESMHKGLTRAEGRTEADYQDALEIKTSAEQWFGQFFNDYDAIITPAALDTAPRLGQGTGDPACCLIWTLCGLPCISMPLLAASNNLPIGVQLVGGYNQDSRLLRTGNWLLKEIDKLSNGDEN